MVKVTSSIGTYQEYSLHEDLKNYYKTETGNLEVKVEKYIIDVVNNQQLIEVQTRNFSQIREKLQDLLELGYSVTLVHPIYEQKLFKTSIGDKQSVRTSPKKDNLLAIFNELVYITDLFNYTNFSLEIVFTKVEIVRKKIKTNKYKVFDKKLLEITRKVQFTRPEDFLFIIPYDLQIRLTTKNLMARLGIPYPLASKMVYFFAKTKLLRIIQKEGNLKIYSVKFDK